jgi:lipoprotein-releasing system permease protein
VFSEQKPSSNRSLGLLTGKLLHNSAGRITGRHWLTFSGIALGVFALLAVSSVMNGFDRDMRQRIIGTRSELRLDNQVVSPLLNWQALIDKLQHLPYIKAASPVVRNELMLVKGSAMAATISFGINLKQHSQVSPVLLPVTAEDLLKPSNQWLQGIINGNPTPAEFEQGGIIIGSELSQSLSAAVGDTLQLISPLGSIPTPLGLLPKTMSVRVAGIFAAGMPEYDRLYSYIPLSSGQFFSSYDDAIDHIDIRTTGTKQLERVTRSLRKEFPSYRVENWSSFDSSLYGAMHFEKALMLVVLGLMFVIASFNMSSNIFRTIVLKRRLIGILKTIGYRNVDIVSVFLRQGLLIALGGIVMGVVLSLVLLALQARFGFIRLPVGNMPKLIIPVHLRLLDYLVIPLAALAITSLSIYLPARQAGRINPITLIRDIA